VDQVEPQVLEDEVALIDVAFPTEGGVPGETVEIVATLKGETGAGENEAEAYTRFTRQDVGGTTRVPANGTRRLNEGETGQFRYSFQMPSNTVDVRVEAWEQDLAGDDKGGEQVVTIEAVTEDEKRVNQWVSMAQWGGAGAVVGTLFTKKEPVLGGLLGAGTGLAARELMGGQVKIPVYAKTHPGQSAAVLVGGSLVLTSVAAGGEEEPRIVRVPREAFRRAYGGAPIG